MKFYGEQRELKIEDLQQMDAGLLIENAEKIYRQAIEQVGDYIIKNEVKIILLAGPSSSGKTTTASKLAHYLQRKQRQVNVVSLDDFYKEREYIKILPDGNRDFESFESFDLTYFKAMTRNLFFNEDLRYRQYDFVTGRRSELMITLRNQEDTIFIFEGIHALNPKLELGLEDLRCKRIYIATDTHYTYQNEVMITPEQLRLARRIIRDYYHRLTSVQETLRQWPDVMEGEERYIKPYLYFADLFINTVHGYEVFVWRHFIDVLTKEIEGFNEEIQTLRKIYHLFQQVDVNQVPKESMIQEFLP